MLKLIEFTEGQWGLVSRRQAEMAGVGWASLSRLVDRALLERVARGVYRVRGAGQPDHLALRAAWLQLDPERPAWDRLGEPGVALVSHVSAAVLNGVGDLRGDIHEFTLPVRRQSRRSDVRLHLGQVPDVDHLDLHGLPVTRPGRMIADLLADHVEPMAIAQITMEVLDRVLDYPQIVAERLAPMAARFHLPADDGEALLDHLLQLARSPHRAALLKEARSG